jgi:hypothetical protein
MNKEFERYNTKIEIPASVVLETIFSTDNKDVETLSRWALKYGFVDLIEKEDGKYYQLQDDYEKQSFYTYLSKKERKQYEYEDYLIGQLEQKENIIKEVREYIKQFVDAQKLYPYVDLRVFDLDKVLEILDKGE